MPKLATISRFKNTHWRNPIFIFLALTFALVTVLATLISIHAWGTMHRNLQMLTREEQDHMDLAAPMLHKELKRLSRDLLTLNYTPGILHFFANPSSQFIRQTLNEGIRNYILHRDFYDMARILDNSGKELIRVEKRAGQAVIIPIEELETKAPDVFEQKVLRLHVRDQIVISPIEPALDRNGEILHPFQPIFRMGIPIFDQQDYMTGILILTCRGKQLLDMFRKTTIHHFNSNDQYSCIPHVLSQEGYWLLSLDKEDEWGFIHDRERRFDRRFPEIWQIVRTKGQGQIKTADGFFTFMTLPLFANDENEQGAGSAYPIPHSMEAATDPAPFWLLINQVTSEDLNRMNTDTKRFHLILFLLILAGSLPLLCWITLLLKRKQDDKTQFLTEKEQTTNLSILLQTIIQIHQAIGQVRKPQKLVQECCDILITSRGYTSAWIIILNQEGKVEISAESALLLNLDQLKQQINMGHPPPCFQECRTTQQGFAIIDTPAIFCADCPMANDYPQIGVICATLAHDSKVFGYLNVLLPIDFARDHEENSRLNEIAKDIGYALFNLEQQEKKMQMERSLRQDEERLRGITNSAQDAILIMDSQGRISFWNPASEKILGYRADEALGKNLHRLLAPSRYHAAHHAAISEFSRTGHGNVVGKTVELSALRKDGREIPITLSLSAIFQDGCWHAVGIVRDMTEHKLMEEQMLQSEKMATIAGLAAGVAHEINTPLSAILQSIQVIRQSLDPALARNREIAAHYGLDLTKVQDYFQEREIHFFMDGIRESAIKSGKIISNLLQFSRPKKLEFASEEITLLLDKAVELAKNDYNLKKDCDILNIEIIREYALDLPLVFCVAQEIEQVFINLLKNAAQAMSNRPEPKPKSRITLRTRQLGEMIRVEIADNGPGIDEETKRRIFDPFFSTKDIGVGTGLGLSVSYTIIVTKHGGQLTVQSVPGQGATFAVDLPFNHKMQQQDIS
jgi:PAS domain S-box-containing protein